MHHRQETITIIIITGTVLQTHHLLTTLHITQSSKLNHSHLNISTTHLRDETIFPLIIHLQQNQITTTIKTNQSRQREHRVDVSHQTGYGSKRLHLITSKWLTPLPRPPCHHHLPQDLPIISLFQGKRLGTTCFVGRRSRRLNK